MSQVIKRDIDWVVDDVSGLIQGYQRVGAAGKMEFTPMPMGRSEAGSRGGSVLRRGFPLLRSPDSLDNLSATGSAAANGVYLASSGGAALTVETVIRNGRWCLQITMPPNNAQAGSVFWRIPSGTRTNAQHLVYEVEDMAEWNGGYITPRLCTDVNLNVGMQALRTIGRSNGYNGIHCVAPRPADWLAVGAGSFASVMTYAGLRLLRKTNPTGSTRIWIYEWAEGEKQSLPQIIFGFDDGHMTSLRGLNILAKDGWKAYMAYMCDGQDGVTRMRDNVEWIQAVQQGHEAVVHGCLGSFPNYSSYAANFAPFATYEDAVSNDIATHIKRMVSAGLDPTGIGRQILVLPQGAHQAIGQAGDNTIFNAMKKNGIKMCRRADTEGQLLVNGGTAGSMMYLPIVGHSYNPADETANINALIASVDAGITAGMSQIIMLHTVRDAPTISEDISPTNLTLLSRTFLGYCQAGRARQGSMYQLFEELMSYDSPVHLS